MGATSDLSKSKKRFRKGRNLNAKQCSDSEYSSSSSGLDDYEADLCGGDFSKVMDMIKNKDERIYDSNFTLYEENGEFTKRKKRSKPVFLKDYQDNQLKVMDTLNLNDVEDLVHMEMREAVGESDHYIGTGEGRECVEVKKVISEVVDSDGSGGDFFFPSGNSLCITKSSKSAESSVKQLDLDKQVAQLLSLATDECKKEKEAAPIHPAEFFSARKPKNSKKLSRSNRKERKKQAKTEQLRNIYLETVMESEPPVVTSATSIDNLNHQNEPDNETYGVSGDEQICDENETASTENTVRLTKQMRKRLKKEEKREKSRIRKFEGKKRLLESIESKEDEDVHLPFTYKQVKKDSFGLSINDILMKDDKELNRLCSMRQRSRYLRAVKRRKSKGSKQETVQTKE